MALENKATVCVCVRVCARVCLKEKGPGYQSLCEVLWGGYLKTRPNGRATT